MAADALARVPAAKIDEALHAHTPLDGRFTVFNLEYGAECDDHASGLTLAEAALRLLELAQIPHEIRRDADSVLTLFIPDDRPDRAGQLRPSDAQSANPDDTAALAEVYQLIVAARAGLRGPYIAVTDEEYEATKDLGED